MRCVMMGLVVLGLVACGESEDGAADDAAGSVDAGQTRDGGESPADAEGDDAIGGDDGGAVPDAAMEEDGGDDAVMPDGGPDDTMSADADDAAVDAGGPVLVNEVPTEAAALNAWLQAGSYRGYAAEPEIHRSTGPHGAGVRTFFNPILDQATRAGLDVWPVGSAAIKELYDRNGVLDGWAVEVKIDADSNAGGFGGGWYWYEVLSTDPAEPPVAAGTGVGLCAGCHSGGVDFITTPFPLPR